MLGRKKIAMIVAEFLGTALLTLVVLAVSKTSIGFPYFVSLAAGLTVGGMVLVLGEVSGAHLNPAITVGLWSVRKIKTLSAIVYVAAQLLGGAVAYLLASFLMRTHWQNTAHFDNHVLVAEAVGAFVLSLGWAAATYRKFEGYQAAVVIGTSFTLGVIAASPASMGLIDPAVALGARVWTWGTYVLGPVAGAVIGFNLYSLLFAPGAVKAKAKK